MCRIQDIECVPSGVAIIRSYNNYYSTEKFVLYVNHDQYSVSKFGDFSAYLWIIADKLQLIERRRRTKSFINFFTRG